MAGVRWISHNPDERKQYIPRVFHCIRFGLLPPIFLYALSNCKNCWEVELIVNDNETARMIKHSISVNMAESIYNHDPSDLQRFRSQQSLSIPIERQWLIDNNAPCPFTPYQKAVTNLTYPRFNNYLEFLRNKDLDYWRTFRFMHEIEGNSESSNDEEEAIAEKPAETPVSQTKYFTEADKRRIQKEIVCMREHAMAQATERRKSAVYRTLEEQVKEMRKTVDVFTEHLLVNNFGPQPLTPEQ